MVRLVFKIDDCLPFQSCPLLANFCVTSICAVLLDVNSSKQMLLFSKQRLTLKTYKHFLDPLIFLAAVSSSFNELSSESVSLFSTSNAFLKIAAIPLN
jgi:hypothetical protein